MYIVTKGLDEKFKSTFYDSKGQLRRGSSLEEQREMFESMFGVDGGERLPLKKAFRLDKLEMIDTPSVVKLLSGLERELCTKYRKCGLSKKTLESIVKLDYDVFVRRLLDLQSRLDLASAEELFSCLDNYYGIKNSHKFVIDVKDLRKFNTSDFADLSEITEEDLDKYGDMTIDFYYKGKYLNLSLKSLRATYTTIIQGKEYSVVNLALNSSVKGQMGNLWCTSIIKDRYPRLYVDINDNSNKCNGCRYSNISTYNNNAKLPNSDRKVLLGAKYCMVGKLRCNNCYCNDKFIPKYTDENLDFDIPLDIHTLVKVWSHVLLSYKNRDTLYRKNSRNAGLRKKAEVHTVRQNNGKYGVLSLKSYTEYEKKVRKEWQGGHHSSPVEHTRRGHVRRYRDEDGNVTKEVFVRGSVVNKGGKTGIYKVR